jgi:hypothetical protein
MRNNFGKKYGWYHHTRVLMASFNMKMQEAEEMRVHQALYDMCYQGDIHRLNKQKE